MNDFLYKLLPMVLSLALSHFIYLKIDKTSGITEKISSKLPVQPKWSAFFCFGCTIIIMLVFGAISIYVINIPAIAFYILGGILIGICNGMTNKMYIKSNK